MPKKAMPEKKSALKPKATPTPPRNDARPKNTGKPILDASTGRSSSRGVGSSRGTPVNNSDIVDMRKAQESRSKRSTGSRTGEIETVKGSKTKGPNANRKMTPGKSPYSQTPKTVSNTKIQGSMRGIPRGFRGGKRMGGGQLGSKSL
jgi:hypothetical protein